MTGDSAAARLRGEEKNRHGRVIAAILAALVMLLAIGAAPQSAAAAPTVTYPGAISGVTIVNETGTGPLGQYQTVRIEADWSVPVGATAGETFGMTLPPEFIRIATGAFTIVDPGTGAVMADCAVASGVGADVVCTLTSAVEGLEEVGGSLWLQVRAATSTTNETVRFDLGDTIEVVDLPGEGGIIPANPTEQTKPYKYGNATGVAGRLKWIVGIPSGHVDGGGFTVSDTLDAGSAGHHYTGEMRLQQRPVVNGAQVGEWTPVDPARYVATFAPDRQSFSFVASGLPTTGFAYELVYFTAADGAVSAGDVFGNHAVVNTIETKATITATESGGGDGTGTVFTRFSITKSLTGAMADAARSATYTVRYAVKGSDEAPKTMTVPVGASALSDRVPLGSTFVIEEIDLPEVPGVSWGSWSLTGEGVRAGENGTYEVTPGSAAAVSLTLTNIADDVPVEPTKPPTPVVPEKPSPSEPPTSPTTPAELALTGGTTGAEYLPLALVLIASGVLSVGIVAARRRRVGRHRA